ncbi:MAG: redox-sensing transcriptional repressor Rex [Clostridia bacterium]
MEGISQETLQRLPSYFRFLKELHSQGIESVSSTVIADKFKMNSVSVRKDLACVSADGGKPKTGFNVGELILKISSFLGYDNVDDAILVGVGKLGSALLGYKGFGNYGLNIVASFDVDDNIINGNDKGFKVFNISKLPNLVNRLKIKIGIITVPAESAQDVCDLMINSGIKAIWNFSPTQLVVPNNIAIKNEDIAASLAILSQKLAEILKREFDT